MQVLPTIQNFSTVLGTTIVNNPIDLDKVIRYEKDYSRPSSIDYDPLPSIRFDLETKSFFWIYPDLISRDADFDALGSSSSSEVVNSMVGLESNKAPSVLAVSDYVKAAFVDIKPTNTTTNINLGTSFNPAPVFGTSATNAITSVNANGFYTWISATQIRLEKDGWINVDSNINYRSSGQRVAIESAFTLDGTVVTSIASTGYIRDQTGHNAASLHHNGCKVLVASGQLLEYVTRRESNTTTAATLRSGASQISIEFLNT